MALYDAFRCLCSLGKMAGKGANLVENLILFFFKKLDAPGCDNKQVITVYHVIECFCAYISDVLAPTLGIAFTENSESKKFVTIYF